MVSGINGYLYSIEELLKRKQSIYRTDIYNCSYAIYAGFNPVGYLGLSNIDPIIKCVEITYALLKTERGKGYATRTLRAITEIILNDVIHNIEKVTLYIHPSNIKSREVAERVGFINDQLLDGDDDIQEYLHYEKTKKIIHLERRK